MILGLTSSDSSNRGYNTFKALSKLGYNALHLKRQKHKFNYPEQSLIFSDYVTVKRLIKSADVVVFTHTCIPVFIDLKYCLEGKRVIQFHGGTVYRQNPKRCNRLINPLVEKTVLVTGDLLGLGAKNEVYIRQPIDTTLFKPDYKIQSRKLVVMHNPSSIESKGTNEIMDALDILSKYCSKRIDVRINTNSVSWKDNIERISKCDIYIDQMQMYQGNKVLGDWGNASLEAAAMGKVVLSSHLAERRYFKEYGVKCPIFAINSKKDILIQLSKLLQLKDSEIKEVKKNTREWVESYHCLIPTAKRIKKLIEL